jgi:hypothetical protein
MAEIYMMEFLLAHKPQLFIVNFSSLEVNHEGTRCALMGVWNVFWVQIGVRHKRGCILTRKFLCRQSYAIVIS